MRAFTSNYFFSGIFFFLCFATLDKASFAQSVDGAFVKSEQERTLQLVAKSNYGFVRVASKGKGYQGALWRADFYSKTNRTHLSVFLFSSKEEASKYGLEYLRGVIPVENKNRARGIAFERHGYVYNGGILFLVRTYDDDKMTIILTLLARKKLPGSVSQKSD